MEYSLLSYLLKQLSVMKNVEYWEGFLVKYGVMMRLRVASLWAVKCRFIVAGIKKYMLKGVIIEID